jgi:hypothetical protein
MIRMKYGHDHGYLLVDHGASPGIPEWMARMAGYDPALAREGKRFEAKTLCCAHCKTHVIPHPQRTERASCPKCNHHYICDVCDFHMRQPDYVHTPFVRTVELALSGKQPLGSPPQLLTP